MTGRSVPLWVGATPDTPAPARVRLRVFAAHGGRCHISGRLIRAGDLWDLEHVKPLHLGGRNAEDNLAPALRDAHREKTAAELTMKAKADRIRAKHLGVYPKSKTPLRGRGFPKRHPVMALLESATTTLADPQDAQKTLPSLPSETPNA